MSIIIVSWNTKDLLRESLNSVISETKHCSYELWVIDNASSDGSGAMVTNEFPDVNLIQNSRNKGFAAANNQGIKASSGKYIVLLNPDTRVIGNAIGKLVAYNDSNPEVCLTGGKLLNPNGRLQPSLRGFPNPVRDFLYASGLSHVLRSIGGSILSRFYFDSGEKKSRLHDGYISGAFLILRRNLLESIGLLDEVYPLYFEETDLCYRIQKSGFKIAYFADAEVIHYGGQSSCQLGATAASLYYGGLFTFYEKFGKSKQLQASRFAIFIASILRCFVLLYTCRLDSSSIVEHLRTCLSIAKVAIYKSPPALVKF